MRGVIKLAKPINEVSLDLDENSLEVNGYVRVVMCKDCAMWHTAIEKETASSGVCLCGGGCSQLAITKRDYFCANGECRKDAIYIR